MARKMTKEEELEYNRLTAQAEQIQLQLDALTNRPTVYGYMRVSSKGQARDSNSLEVQERDLKGAGAEIIYRDVYTGTTTDRPEFDKLLTELKPGELQFSVPPNRKRITISDYNTDRRKS